MPKLLKYEQGYQDGATKVINEIKKVIEQEENFIPDKGFDYLLSKIAEVVLKEEKILEERKAVEK